LAQDLQATLVRVKLSRAVEGTTMRLNGKLRMSTGKIEHEHQPSAAWIFAALCAAWSLLSPHSALAEERTVPCDGFCDPVATRQLDRQRGQGLETSVILWDELNRHQTAPPPPPTSSQGPVDVASVRVGPVAAPNIVLTGAGR
jgi:hypothetical protein